MAQHNIGVFYKNGMGVFKDYKLSNYYLYKAASAGYAPAQASLGQNYING